MQKTENNVSTYEPWIVTHPVTTKDAATMAAIRATAAPYKGKLQGTAARHPFDATMERVIPPDGITFHKDTVGDVSGWWCRPIDSRSREAILFLHGGWFNWGSAQAYRNIVGHIAAHAGAAAFIPDYRLAPENPFPSALKDVQGCFLGLIALGFIKVAVAGDSSGGNLALGLLSFAEATKAPGSVVPVGCVALSPVTDLTLSQPSWETRAAADPYFVRSQAAELVRSYLGDHEPTDPLVSPLYAELTGLPPIRVHVGEDEVLLDDSLRYIEKAVKAGVDARVDVWEGMFHVFLSGVGTVAASAQALDAIGGFLTERLTTG